MRRAISCKDDRRKPGESPVIRSPYLDDVGAPQREYLHDALALGERHGGALVARPPEVLPPRLHLILCVLRRSKGGGFASRGSGGDETGGGGGGGEGVRELSQSLALGRQHKGLGGKWAQCCVGVQTGRIGLRPT